MAATDWEKLSVDYANMRWVEPASQKSFSLLLALTKLFLTHCDTGGNRISFKLFLITKENLDAFNEQNPTFIINASIKSLLDILYTLGTAKRMNSDQKEEINAAITAKAGLSEPLERFWRSLTPPKENTSGLYGMLSEYLYTQFRIVRFLYLLATDAIELVSDYRELNDVVLNLPTVANRIFLAEITRAQGLERAQEVSNKLTQVMNRLELYFKIAGKNGIDPSKPQVLKTNLELFLPPITIASPGSLFEMSEHRRMNSLMSYVILARPFSITEWAEIKVMGLAVQSFFDKLQSTKADPLAKSLKQLPGIKAEITGLRDRVIEMTADDSAPCSDEITAVMAEVDDTISQLSRLFSEGLTIDSPTVGIDGKQVCFSWKKLLLIKRSQMLKHEKKQDEAASKVSDRAEKLVKIETLPICSRTNWGIFLIQWKKIEKNFLDDESRGLALKAKLVDKTDISNTKNMSYLDVYDYLTARYGSFQAIFADDLDALQETKPCHSSKDLECFLVKLLTFL